MDSWEWNKIAGAVLGTLIFVLVIKFATEAIFEPEKPVKEAYHVEGVVETPAGGGAAAPAEEPMPDWGTVLASADAGAGKTTSTKCLQCHDISKGGPNKIGPELWGVLGRPRASEVGFSYSTPMASDHSPWTFDKIFKFVKQPQTYVPGTKMTFAGLPSAKERINLIAFLRTQEDTPMPIPPPAPAKPAGDTKGSSAPGAGAAPPGGAAAPPGSAAPAAGGGATPAPAPGAGGKPGATPAPGSTPPSSAGAPATPPKK